MRALAPRKCTCHGGAVSRFLSFSYLSVLLLPTSHLSLSPFLPPLLISLPLLFSCLFSSLPPFLILVLLSSSTICLSSSSSSSSYSSFFPIPPRTSYSLCANTTDLRLYSSIRHFTFCHQLLLPYRISSFSMAPELTFRDCKPGKLPVPTIVCPPPDRQPSGLSSLLHRHPPLHRAKPCVLGDAPRSCPFVLGV